MPCSRYVQSHRGPPGRQRHERKESALSDGDPRYGPNTTAIQTKPKNSTITTPLRVWSLETEQRENHKSSAAPHPHNTTQSLQVCFASAKSHSGKQPFRNSCCKRRCGNTVPTTSTSHGWPTILVVTNRTTNNKITQTRCNSMHRRIAQCSGRLSHTPTARLTDSDVGQHCPKRRCRTGDHHRNSSINKQQ